MLHLGRVADRIKILKMYPYLSDHARSIYIKLVDFVEQVNQVATHSRITHWLHTFHDMGMVLSTDVMLSMLPVRNASRRRRCSRRSMQPYPRGG